MTPAEVRILHESVVKRIVTLDYQTKIYAWTLENHRPQLDINDPKSICAFWNDFWFLLPDDPCIRTDPFFDICQLAEGEYLEDNCK